MCFNSCWLEQTYWALCESIVDTVFVSNVMVTVPVQVLICRCWFLVDCGDDITKWSL